MSSEHNPGNEVLFRDGELTISSARIEQGGNSCAAKYISTVNYSSNNPSRSHAWAGLCVCAVAILTSMLYLYLGKLGITVYVVLHLVMLTIAILIAYLYLFSPQTYSLEISLVNGQKFTIERSNETAIREISKALKDAVALNRAVPEPANWTAADSSPPPLDVAPFLNPATSSRNKPAVQRSLPFSAGR